MKDTVSESAKNSPICKFALASLYQHPQQRSTKNTLTGQLKGLIGLRELKIRAFSFFHLSAEFIAGSIDFAVKTRAKYLCYDSMRFWKWVRPLKTFIKRRVFGMLLLDGVQQICKLSDRLLCFETRFTGIHENDHIMRFRFKFFSEQLPRIPAMMRSHSSLQSGANETAHPYPWPT